ncbi:MAG: hypothetical protein H8D45_22040 [Bacteroidetes bacterium]|nr:hypothetical protein [Bacteroidota bacterium]MBL7103807.1 hypothetical protein [Bacteroidales bacterium]
MKTCTFEKNKQNCNCTYPCSKKGICCECISYHRRINELPACYFPSDIEHTYDRSIENFIRIYKERGSAYLQ